MSNRFKGEFIGFSFKGIHCSELGITRVTAGDRYTVGLFADIEDKTETVAGKIGAYYFGTQINAKPITLDFAFDEVSDFQLSQLSDWLGGRELGQLIFDEYPYKYYMAKVSNQVNISYLPFEEIINGEEQNVYKGEGSIQFTAYNPLAYNRGFYLDNYRDEKNVIYDMNNLPSWFLSGQILPESTYNKIGAKAPTASQSLYVGGMSESPIDIEIKFNSATRNSANVQNSISTLNGSITAINQQITGLSTQRQTHQQQVDSLTVQRDAQVNIVIISTRDLETNKTQINTSIGKILTYSNQITTYENQLVSVRNTIGVQTTQLGSLNNTLVILNSTLAGLLILVNPSADKIAQINNTQDLIDKILLEIDKTKQLLFENNQKEADLQYYITDYQNRKLTEETNLSNLQQTQIQLQNKINVANGKIIDLDRQLGFPTKKVYELSVQITELIGQKNTLTNQVQTLGATGVALTGNVITFSRPQQMFRGKIYPAKNFTIQVDNDLRSKVLHIKASNHEVCFFDGANRRQEYYHNFVGDFLTAVPTGFAMVKRGIFNAGASLVNTLELETKLTAQEKAFILNKNIVFKEDYRSMHQTSRVINVRTAASGKDELVLSNGYSLTNGIRNLVVLNDLMIINISDIRFIETVNFKTPYLYY